MTIQELEKVMPSLFGLLVTEGTTSEVTNINVMAISWWTVVSNNPPRLILSVSKKSLSSQNILENGELSLNLMSDKYKTNSIACGFCSGRAENKIHKNKFTVDQLNGVNVIKEAVISISCSVVEKHESGDHNVFLVQVSDIISREKDGVLLAFNGYKELHSVD